MKLFLSLVIMICMACTTPTSVEERDQIDDDVLVASNDLEIAMATRALDDLVGKTNGDRVCVTWYAQTCCSQDGSYCCCYAFAGCHCATP